MWWRCDHLFGQRMRKGGSGPVTQPLNTKGHNRDAKGAQTGALFSHLVKGEHACKPSKIWVGGSFHATIILTKPTGTFHLHHFSRAQEEQGARERKRAPIPSWHADSSVQLCQPDVCGNVRSTEVTWDGRYQPPPTAAGEAKL